MIYLTQIAGIALAIFSLLAVGYILGFGHALKRVNEKRQFQLTDEDAFVLVGHRLHQLQHTAETRRRAEPLFVRTSGRTLMRLDQSEISEYHQRVGQWQSLQPDWYRSFERRVYASRAEMGPGWQQFVAPTEKH